LHHNAAVQHNIQVAEFVYVYSFAQCLLIMLVKMNVLTTEAPKRHR